MKTYKKLVRDKIPKIIKANGGKCEFHVATKEEFAAMLTQKLLEEVQELIENPCAEEIADVLEVVEAIARLKGISLDDIKTWKLEKKVTKGGFTKGIVLDKATEEKLERDGSHVHLKTGNTEKLNKDFKTSGNGLKK